MYLKKIELAGFKSFADRTVIDFEDSITGIVGPNGSGKSNITEAVRWVLGEQSARNLRGGKMPDVIFAGSDSRKPLNISEVTVVLDNSDHYLPVDYSEVSVVRRLHRTGESEFFLNKQACRLKDIQELFMDSGLGKESFSIISQGKVEAIFASKPQDRRGIFEEAAGVLKYKQRKKQAEQKLFETEDNLSRVQDIVYELEDQMAPLKEQSATAKQYLALKEEFTKIDVAYTVAEMKEAKIAFGQAAEQLESLNTELTTIAQTIQQKEARLQEQRLSRSQLDQWLEKNNQTQVSLVEALKQAEGQQEVLQERSKHTQKSAQEYQENLAEVKEKLTALEAEKTDLVEKLSQKNGLVQTIEKEIEQAQTELQKYQKSTKELIEELRAKYVDQMQEQANIGNELKYLERQYTQEMAKNQTSLEKQENTNQDYEQKQQAVTEVTTQLEQLQSTLSEQKRQFDQLQEKQRSYQKQYENAQNKMYQLMDETRQIKARIKSLQDIQENYSGFYQGVRVVLQQQNELSGIKGAVAELIEVPSDYTLAIETALGAQAQHIVVENEAAARDGITFLKQRRAGRATFLPMTTIKPRQLSAAASNQAQNVSGCIGVASQLIDFSAEYSAIIQNLLGTTLIAQDLQSANEIARAVQFRYRVVSLSGDVMNAGGSMTGGATKRGNQGSLFSQANELQTLKEQAQRSDQRLQTIEKQVAQFQQQATDCQKEIENLRTKGETARLEEQELQSRKNHMLEEIERLNKEQKIYEFENREVQNFIADYQEQKETLSEQQKNVEEQLQQLQTEMQELNEQDDLIEKRRTSLSQELSEKKAELAVNKEQISTLKQQIQTNEQTVSEQSQRKKTLTKQLDALTSNVSDHEVTEESLQKQVATLTQKKDELQEQLRDKREERDRLYQEINEQDENLSQLNQQQKGKLAEKTTVEVEKNRQENLLDHRLDYLQEEYHITFEKAEFDYEPVERNNETKEQIQHLRRKIEQLGPVNLNAIEQYEEVAQRYDFLHKQREDLLTAKNQLFTTMDEMDEEVKVRFKDIFEKIREQFKVVFPNMFGGGRAELFLTDPNDLLNTGVEIEAQPPGKKLQNLSLLSGGERALTAIALLFSIIQVRPVPFCVLDEVEAALDEANILRFANYLQTFNNDTQFIVVTHRKGTMEACNVLYGITMEESGVSKIVSVRLEDVAENGQIAVEGKDKT
ncbi:chromosome segregation protein SMC [Tetragenococcus koreensis]|uniref:chromosome segregation protein SMC n=1 Tax=Tetragenococcus koreensis TaxID=290335 RepID=UPI001F420ABB|nr:chromosome segregation protein SMC [Tetragenococcus koreensis]MCF1585363.1 chromosome segregation protein SMC [Tetragenococcus koreensis]MCF1614936.1 chromosome segregation protein SMC [Tetragenococcus koreensis]MCF1619083.1 chromosome segregation protein SMC [Tetragenococcus koreensis]MCF1624737.1 chromosome segregation protein SMC [Tetragenococcus koreensis]MCF1629628.1 chromosome segregation protein SMC [Tetragenococcus koreensis]